MPYAYKYYLLVGVVDVIAFLVTFRWLAPYGLLACLGFAAALAYLTIIFGRWLFGRKGL